MYNNLGSRRYMTITGGLKVKEKEGIRFSTKCSMNSQHMYSRTGKVNRDKYHPLSLHSSISEVPQNPAVPLQKS